MVALASDNLVLVNIQVSPVHLLTFKTELGETPWAGERTSQQAASGLLSCASACAAAVTLGKIIAMARTFIASSLI
jgi:hypothetical protein